MSPWEDCKAIGKLLGTRTVLNELIAFNDLGDLKDQHPDRSLGRDRQLCSLRLCQHQLDRHPAGRHRRARARAAARPRAAGVRALLPEPWPITFRPASRESSYDGHGPSSHRPTCTHAPRGRRSAHDRRRRCRRGRHRARLGTERPRRPGRGRTVIPYARFPTSRATVAGHAGQVLCGKLAGEDVVVFQGRFHYYEGHDLDTVTFPVRVIQELGVKTLILTAATGGIREDLRPGV